SGPAARRQSGPAAGPPRPTARLLHGDAATIHWRIDPDGVAAALDFGDAGVGDPVWDLVALTYWDDARLPAVLDGYAADPALRQRLTRWYEPYRAIRHLQALEWLLAHGYDASFTISELTRNHAPVQGLTRSSPRTGG
ncbi:MAG: phosphotransferase, partial [Micromonosporaceae bacterium]